ncbi:MAG: thioredoxin domain-containing protein [bacterium]|nr:thioredoxin domain-containing protein [bacterium]
MENNSESNKFLVPLAIIVAGGLVAGAIYFGGANPSTSSGQATNTEIDIAPVGDKDHILGSRNAEFVIVEYSDTECPFCKVFHNTMKEVMRTYGTQVAWVYRQLPIPQLHARAMKEAEATECAAELGGNQVFWNYLDAVFEKTNSNDSLDPAELPKIAAAVGLNVEAFNECLASDRHQVGIEASIAEAAKAGARGTPYSVILSKDGKKTVINGAEPLANVKIKIDSLLK